MTEIHFIVEDALEGGYLARAVGTRIIAEADDMASLHAQLREAVDCRFEPAERSGLIWVHVDGEALGAA